GPDSVAHALAPKLLVLTEASAPSTVHRSVYPYYVGVKTFDADGQVTGEHRFLGVFTTNAIHDNVLDIPVVSRRVREVIHRAGFPLDSYSGQRMLEVIQNWPRSELFSSSTDSLYATATGVIALADRRRLRFFLRRDPFKRFFSCLVFLPRDRYTTTTRLAMQEVLLAELGGSNLEYSARIGEFALAQVYFTVHTDPSVPIEPWPTRLSSRYLPAITRSGGWVSVVVPVTSSLCRTRSVNRGGMARFTRFASARSIASVGMTQSPEPADLALAADFTAPTREHWQELVAGVLRKA
ncbi:NAD-glutamate dehydrogenase, partial [Kibdelosporangium lantanae]